jgi:hypothetical protein
MNPQDLLDIRKTPLYSRVVFDYVVWKSTPSGCYTVKSAYKLCEKSSDNVAACFGYDPSSIGGGVILLGASCFDARVSFFW